MPHNLLSTDQQISKLNQLSEMAADAVSSDDFCRKIGALTIYANLLDFNLIQAARLLEQIILKERLITGQKEKLFKPHEDIYFYSNQIRSRRIIKEIKKFMPFARTDSCDPALDMDTINAMVFEYLEKANRFLNLRNKAIHHMPNPQHSMEKIIQLVDNAISTYNALVKAQKLLFEALVPFRFGPAEIGYFYGGNINSST